MKDSTSKMLETKQRMSMGTDTEEEKLNHVEDHQSSLQVHPDDLATSTLVNDYPKLDDCLLCADGYSQTTVEQDDTITEMMSSVGSIFFRMKKKHPSSMEEEPSLHGDLDTESDAMKRYRRFLDRSTMKAADWDYPSFECSELMLGKFLGKGRFSMVEEIRGIRFAESTSLQCQVRQRSNSIAIDDKESRKFIAQHCIRPSGDSRYALKRIRPDLLEDPNHCAIATTDLLLETYFLQRLQHAHIIKLRAIGKGNDFYFLVLDRLYDTLATRIQKWKDDDGFFSFLGNRRRHRERLEERLSAAFYLSSALRYLHEHRVVHRDLKPENIGFDVRGDIKIFDFGLARELMEEDACGNGLYMMSSMTGSLRYMAPEVYFRGRPYNAGCDVYSFAVLFWEMLALDRPYSKYRDEKAFAMHVLKGGRRPPLKKAWSRNCRILLQQAWEENVKKRIEMKEVNAALRRELIFLGEGDDSDFDHVRRRSTFVFQRMN